MKKYYDSGDVGEMFEEIKGLIKDLWCSVNELLKRTPVNIGNGIGWFKRYYKNTWEFKSIIAGNNITITDNGDDITISATGSSGGFDCSDLNSCSTDNLPEGATNLYFTDSRAVTALTGENISIFANNVGYLTTNFINSITDTATINLTLTGSALSADFIGNTSNVPESGNLYYTDARARAAISLATIGTSGAATYNNLTGVLNIPVYTSPVTSVFGRTGAVIAQSGDYSADKISTTSYGILAGTDSQAQLRELADYWNPAAVWTFYTDWEGAGINGATITSDKCALDVVGAGAGALPISALTNTIGVFGVTTGTTSTGGAYLGSGPNCLLLGGGTLMVEHRIYHPILSDGTQTFTTRVGIVNQMAGDGTNGVYFRYTNGVNGGRFQCVCRSGGSEAGSVVDSGITVAATTWYKLRIVVNSAATSVDFYIDNVLVATITTNIPTASNGLATQITKTVGTTARLIYVDWSSASKIMVR